MNLFILVLLGIAGVLGIAGLTYFFKPTPKPSKAVDSSPRLRIGSMSIGPRYVLPTGDHVMKFSSAVNGVTRSAIIYLVEEGCYLCADSQKNRYPVCLNCGKEL